MSTSAGEGRFDLRPPSIKISPMQRKVLKVLATIVYNNEDASILFFRGIERRTRGMNQRQIRLACRALARKGLVKHEIAWSDEGLAGSGYQCTRAGYELINGGGPT